MIGERKRNGEYHVVVNGISVSRQFAIYANHQPNRTANARLVWDRDRYLDGGKYGQSPRGQHVLILKHPIGPGVEITADYGPSYGYDVQGFSRSGHTTAAYTTDSDISGRRLTVQRRNSAGSVSVRIQPTTRKELYYVQRHA
eukprot:SAG25_NODE_2412_length_1631_cov_18.496084_2_plen_141_part_01